MLVHQIAVLAAQACHQLRPLNTAVQAHSRQLKTQEASLSDPLPEDSAASSSAVCPSHNLANQALFEDPRS